MKNEFNARPVYLSRKDRIHSHFLICFLSLIIYRYLEKKLDNKYTTTEIIETLRNYTFKNENDVGYSPLYKRTNLIDKLHNSFGFNTAFEIIPNKNIKKIITNTKK